MGWIDKKPYVAPHECPTPELYHISGRPTWGGGSTWECDNCAQQWKVVADAFEMVRWAEIGSKTRLVES